MDVVTTIELATRSLNITQSELAEMLGMPRTHLSNFKKGRPISYQKHAQIAAVAGLQDRAIRILLAGMASTLSDDYPHEQAAKAALSAILNAFPEQEPTITAAPRSKGASARGVATDKPRLRKSLGT